MTQRALEAKNSQRDIQTLYINAEHTQSLPITTLTSPKPLNSLPLLLGIHLRLS